MGKPKIVKPGLHVHQEASNMGSDEWRNREEFCDYLESTLIPDLRESGRDATADDFQAALYFIWHPGK